MAPTSRPGRRPMRALSLSLSLLFAGTTLLAAQSNGAPAAPRRPTLPPQADSCDATVYYRFGLTQLERDPATAAAAFYWAQRLSPNSAVTYYAQRIALLMADVGLLRNYVEGDRRTLQSARVKRIDSLQLRAVTLDPFVPQLLDEQMLMAYYRDVVRERLGADAPTVSDFDINVYLQRTLADAGPATRAWLAFGRGRFAEAAAYWAGAVRRDRKDAYLRVRRSQALFLSGAPDSARAELEAALVAARRTDAEKMQFIYDSKALWEYELGRLHEAQGRDSLAREAYQRALVEDLSLHPAHVRLATVALRSADTATAVMELQRAIEVKGDDFAAHLLLGSVLAGRRALEPATVELRRAAEIEPWVAHPHLVLGDVRRDAGDREGAASEYRRFLALAAQGDPAADTARSRLAGLSAGRP